MRRALVFYALLLAARAFGVELVRPSVAPVQLTFSFAAPAAIAPLTATTPFALSAPLAAAPTLSLDAVALAAPAPAALPLAQPALAAAPPEAAALAASDAASPKARPAPIVSRDEDGDDGRAQLRRLARDAGDPSRVFDASRRTKMDYEEFGRQLARRPGLDHNPFNQADAKRRVLAASGYTHLYGSGGVRIPIGEASDVRIGSAFNSVKKTFDRRPRSSPPK